MIFKTYSSFFENFWRSRARHPDPGIVPALLRPDLRPRLHAGSVQSHRKGPAIAAAILHVVRGGRTGGGCSSRAHVRPG